MKPTPCQAQERRINNNDLTSYSCPNPNFCLPFSPTATDKTHTNATETGKNIIPSEGQEKKPRPLSTSKRYRNNTCIITHNRMCQHQEEPQTKTTNYSSLKLDFHNRRPIWYQASNNHRPDVNPNFLAYPISNNPRNNPPLRSSHISPHLPSPSYI